jgi:hypothetical protein
MVTKGYQKGVYERVTKGISWKTLRLRPKLTILNRFGPLVQMRYGAVMRNWCNLRAAKLQETLVEGRRRL